MPTGADPISGKVALLSGATGAVGAELARQLQARGARVAVAVRKPWQVGKVTEALRPERLLVGCVPTLDGEAAAGFVKGAADALGPIDALFCAAGAYRANPIGKDPAGELEDLLAANLQTAATLARAVVGPMKRRRTGSMVFVGSLAVGQGGAGHVNYLASKAALHEYVRALAVELADAGVRVAAVLPATIDTPANRAASPNADPSAWIPVAAVAEAMIDCALGTLPGPGPLYPLRPRR